MPSYNLLLSCETDGVQEIQRTPNTPLIFTFKCSKCGEIHENVQLLLENKEQIPNSRGDTQLNIKCKCCKSTNTVDVKSNSLYNNKNQNSIFNVEIRGSFMPINWRFESFTIIATSSNQFKCQDSEFVDWDDIGDCNVSVLEMKYSIE
uniref:Uncharacterized protein n=1 Tax=Trepomonas sp. PC1 TaxID=1076344 RepID=A0A146K249_9EUKA|eukprot:JAP90953.1 Hypothetical protein TPC1_17586 [Trepomonas sp. PC1]